MKNPYESLPPEAFWKPCLDSGDKHLNQLYKPKKPLLPESKVATAGSCFAQYFRSRLIESNLSFVDVEPKPDLMSYDVGRGFGYGIYSARFGNIYTTRQLRQLVEDCTTLAVHEGAIWEQEGR
ncbi:MAG: GSCFA domain-containing protein, partial [Pseudomonadota bacterium]